MCYDFYADMNAPLEFSTLYIFTFIINSVGVLSCSVLPSRQWRRHVWHPVSCLFVHFNIHLTYSLYSIKLIQLRPKLNLRFFSICSSLGFQRMKYPTFSCATRLQFPCILLLSRCQVVFLKILYDVSGRISRCTVFVDLWYEAIHILLRVLYRRVSY
jgi:hypothetical protein